jgi:hypothetical protein
MAYLIVGNSVFVGRNAYLVGGIAVFISRNAFSVGRIAFYSGVFAFGVGAVVVYHGKASNLNDLFVGRHDDFGFRFHRVSVFRFGDSTIQEGNSPLV